MEAHWHWHNSAQAGWEHHGTGKAGHGLDGGTLALVGLNIHGLDGGNLALVGINMSPMGEPWHWQGSAWAEWRHPGTGRAGYGQNVGTLALAWLIMGWMGATWY